MTLSADSTLKPIFDLSCLGRRVALFLFMGLLVVLSNMASATTTGGEMASGRVFQGNAVLKEQAKNLRVAQPSKAVTEVYRHYQETLRQGGKDLRFELRDFRTVDVDEYQHYRWLDIFSPPTGWRLSQSRTYYRAPWLDEPEVSYDLQWIRGDSASEKEIFRDLKVMKGWTVLDAAEWLTNQGHWERVPFAITTFRARVVFEGRRRDYRATAFWYPDEERGDFVFTVQDRIVPEVASAMGETARVVPPGVIGRGPGPQKGDILRMTGELQEQSCEAKTRTVTNSLQQTWDVQGHHAGRHEARFKMQAECVASSDCYNQCNPFVLEKNCFETADSNLPTLCEHLPVTNHEISANSSQGATTAQCGAAMGCGVRECCGIGSCDSGVSISFSGSGGGLSASVSSSGSDPVYGMTISDRVTCPAPREVDEDPCASKANLGDGFIVDAIFIPCGGSDEDGGDHDTTGGTGGGSNTGTPIVLDFGRGGFEFTDSPSGVDFDLDADGILDQVSWTAAGTADAFLVLDRNGNGSIDHGGELFGDATAQAAPQDGELRHGFRALAEFDREVSGGNGDGWITSDDDVFPSLELWNDWNHDGVAQAGERRSLAAAGVVGLGLSFAENRSRDIHGNQLRYRGRYQLTNPAGHVRVQPMVDVVFLKQ